LVGIGLVALLCTGAVNVWDRRHDAAAGGQVGGATSAPTASHFTEAPQIPTSPVDSSTPPPSTPIIDPPTEPPTTAPPTTQRPTRTAVDPPTPVPPKPATTQYLADARPTVGDPGEGPATIAGNKVTCLRSIRFPINGFQGEYTAVYPIEAQWNTFRATIGIDNRTKPGAKIHFLVYLDDALVNDGYLLTYYDSRELKIDVRGKSVIKLYTEVVEAGGVGGTGRSVWGNARFTK
jgi:hypothetical protein